MSGSSFTTVAAAAMLAKTVVKNTMNGPQVSAWLRAGTTASAALWLAGEVGSSADGAMEAVFMARLLWRIDAIFPLKNSRRYRPQSSPFVGRRLTAAEAGLPAHPESEVKSACRPISVCATSYQKHSNLPFKPR
jgi:hypothetical protein